MQGFSLIIAYGVKINKNKRGFVLLNILLFVIAFGASTIGAISGIGGGVIIKPVMDAFSGMPIGTINFLSGCTVLTMSVSSFIRGLKNKADINYAISIPLAIGASIGGICGKAIFASLSGNLGLLQSSLLLAINIFVFLYILKKSKIVSLHVQNMFACIAIGFALGCISSFLGIGGGPINIAVLYYFFSMTPKITAKNSLFIILFSQITSLITTFATNDVPTFSPVALGLMCLGGVVGAIIGGKLDLIMDDDITEKFFMVVLSLLILLNVYNIFNFILLV